MTLSHTYAAMIGGLLGLFAGLHVAFYSIDPPHTCPGFFDGKLGAYGE